MVFYIYFHAQFTEPLQDEKEAIVNLLVPLPHPILSHHGNMLRYYNQI